MWQLIGYLVGVVAGGLLGWCLHRWLLAYRQWEAEMGWDESDPDET